ncbi:sulfotransferase domain-containing protein [Tindallia californiensis]|uniref:Sulfotransferase domain-containing protein n=1 Tax=Tindallia californiensis TaxID=159292 RepID=A0A1H3PCF8_9FIRM|nr:sulfotransferase domain-containing protein [Tindallia californiensis]SDY98748.1 Sulfotransferase domain-containing protein [Tindallia californiensis]
MFWSKKKKKMPDFLIIGAQKSGTTSLYNYLIQHPNIYAAIQKEIHYFDSKFDKPKEWYGECFPSLKTDEEHITGEATPYYIFHPLAPIRIKKMIPKSKIIILLRNPIDRAFSHYHHAVRNLGETMTFENAIEKESERLRGELEKFYENPYYHSYNYQHFSYLKRGIYVDQLEVWYSLFPRKQILVLEYENFFGDLPASMGIVCEFLEVSMHSFECKPLNVGKYTKMAPETRVGLRAYFEPHNQRLYRYLGRTYNWK